MNDHTTPEDATEGDTVLLPQTDLANRLGISQAWLSEATSDGKRVNGGAFDPSAYAVYTEGGRLDGYRLPADHDLVRGHQSESPPVPEPVESGGDRADGRGTPLLGTPEATAGDVALPAFARKTIAPAQQTTNVSLLPEGTDVARTSGYAATGYAAGQLAQANPEVAPALTRLLGAGAGAVLGYEVGGTPRATLIGAGLGVLITEGIERLQNRGSRQHTRSLPPGHR